MDPIYYPSSPYKCKLSISPGESIKFNGQAKSDARKFSISFLSRAASSRATNKALNLDISLNPPKLVTKTWANGSWAEAEIKIDKDLVLCTLEPFELEMFAESKQFKIEVNGSFLCYYRHQIPYQAITHLATDGQVYYKRILRPSNHEGPQAIRTPPKSEAPKQTTYPQHLPFQTPFYPGYMVPSYPGPYTFLGPRAQYFTPVELPWTMVNPGLPSMQMSNMTPTMYE